MKRGTQLFALIAFVLAGARLTSGPTAAISSQAAGAAARVEIAMKGAHLQDTTCGAFANPVDKSQTSDDAHKTTPDRGEIIRLLERFLYGPSQDSRLSAGSLPEGMRLVFATVPDPVHTHLSLQFDRELEAIQQAVQDERYTYDSSWLPWKQQSADESKGSDPKAEAQNVAQREVCPGMILFRRNMRASRTADGIDECSQVSDQAIAAYECGMIIFVIGETPTAGLNWVEWNNAQWWVNTYASKSRKDKSLRILGPTFSGSVPSFVRALESTATYKDLYTNILLYTGRIRGCASWRWLESQMNARPNLRARIADFEENDAIQSDRLYRYLEDRGHHLSEVAVLSEDETAYGGLPDSHPAATDRTAAEGSPDSDLASCTPTYPQSDRPVHLYYPRDISAIRSAYQEQSIFSPKGTTDSSTASRMVLRPESNGTSNHNTDTIEPFSGSNLALTQEAQLYGVVNTLKTHGIRYIILRSTNSLDYLFLARFFHRAYPDAYIVTMGTDLLFAREIDSTEFRGIASLSSFPLLPRGQDWSKQTDNVPQHAHRVFGSYTMEGDYLATRFLITDPEVKVGEKHPFAHPSKVNIPDYAPPFWDASDNDPEKSQPSTWLSVIGRDGYWPLAILKEPYSHSSAPRFSNLAIVQKFNETHATSAGPSTVNYLSLSTLWKFCCVMALFAFGLHFYGCHSGWRVQDFGMFIQFTPSSGNRGLALIALGWSAVCAVLLLLFLTSYRIYEWLGSVDRLWVWAMGLSTLAGCIVANVEIRSWRVEDGKRRISFLYWHALTLALICLPGVIEWLMFSYGAPDPNGVAMAYRSVHLASGVSPILSLMVLLSGLYWWFWQALSGLALLGNGRPTLPTCERSGLTLISQGLAEEIDAAAKPFPTPESAKKIIYLLPLFGVCLEAAVMRRPWSDGYDLILHTLENRSFNWMLHILFWIALFLLLMDCVQLLLTWLALKRLLVALNRLPLRRTFAALQGLPMRSLWSLSGTSSRARYQIFSHQLESLLHLRNELDAFASRHSGNLSIRRLVADAWTKGQIFIQQRSTKLDLAMVNDAPAQQVRIDLSTCAKEVLEDLLVPEWNEERTSLDLAAHGEDCKRIEHLPTSDKPAVALAEEFICLMYVGYLQNMLARMRTIALSMIGIFAAIALSVAFYPFTPRPTLALLLMLLLLAIGATVAMVYAGLARDSTLSHITNTEPGSLGGEFWLRILSFVGVPALGLIVAQFPEIADFVISWVQPGLNAAK